MSDLENFQPRQGVKQANGEWAHPCKLLRQIIGLPRSLHHQFGQGCQRPYQRVSPVFKL
jgi:hypothetical protein